MRPGHLNDLWRKNASDKRASIPLLETTTFLLQSEQRHRIPIAYRSSALGIDSCWYSREISLLKVIWTWIGPGLYIIHIRAVRWVSSLTLAANLNLMKPAFDSASLSGFVYPTRPLRFTGEPIYDYFGSKTCTDTVFPPIKPHT